MSFAPSDPSDDVSSDLAPASPGPVGSPPAVAVPPSLEEAARENARNGRWAMNEYFSGWVLLGADGKPVMRNDGSRVGFFFHDSARLASELAGAQAPGASLAIEASPEGEDEADGRAKGWRAHRRALAPLDSGFNADWDPQRPRSQLADKTKWTKLLAYYYAQTTEPKEAVRRAVSVIFGTPVTDESGTKLWVPGNYDAGTIKSIAETLVGQVLGPVSAVGKDAGTAGAMPGGNASSFSNSLGGVGMAGLGFPETPVSAQLDKTDGPTVGDPQVGQSEDTTEQDRGADSSVTPLSSGTVPPPPRKPPPPPEPERDPPRPNVRQQDRQWRRTPPQDQPDDVKDALAKSHLKEVWREVLRRKFETEGRSDEGYGTYVFERGDFAYGAYQFRKPALVQIGVRTKDGRWTGKFGVRGWQDFLNSAEAQEAALAEWTRYLEEAVDLHHTARLGREISTPEGKINVTRSGLVGAMHLRGRRGVILYMQWIESNNWTSPVQKPANRQDSFNDIEKRLRGFEHVPY